MIIYIEDDFNLDKIADSGQCFRWEKTGEAAYRIPFRDKCLYIEAAGGNAYDVSCTQQEFQNIWYDYFDLGTDYRMIRGRIDEQKDPFLYQAAEREKGIRILQQDSWEMLISFIISQNKNIPAIRRSIALLAAACGNECSDSKGVSYYAFPRPEAVLGLDSDQLRACSLGYRCKYVQAAAEFVSEGKINFEELQKADDKRAIEVLTEIYGVGIKVASCIALFGMHHLNAFPRDVWVKRILENEYPNGYPFSDYDPYNGVYQQYMFAYYRNIKTLRETRS